MGRNGVILPRRDRHEALDLGLYSNVVSVCHIYR